MNLEGGYYELSAEVAPVALSQLTNLGKFKSILRLQCYILVQNYINLPPQSSLPILEQKTFFAFDFLILLRVSFSIVS